MLDTWIKFIEAHERLLLVAVAGVVIWFGIGRIEQLVINHDKGVLAQVQAKADSDTKANAALAAQVTQDAADRKALEDKMAAQNAQLEQVNATLAAALANHQKIDAALPPNELVARWNTLVPTAGATVTPNGVTLPNAGAVSTVQELESVPVLRTQYENERTQNGNDKAVIAADDASILLLNHRVDGLNTQIVDNDKVCQATVKLKVAEATKSKRKWFIAGVVTGVSIRAVIKLVTGF